MSDNLILAALVRLEAGQADLSDRMNRLDSDLSDRMNRLDSDLSGRMDRLDAGQTDLSGRMDRLDAGFAAVRTEMSTFRSSVIDELGKTRGEIMAKVEGLQDSVTLIHADIAVNFGAVDQARLINNNTRDEMRGLNDLVARMMTLILRLQTEVAELKGKP